MPSIWVSIQCCKHNLDQLYFVASRPSLQIHPSFTASCGLAAPFEAHNRGLVQVTYTHKLHLETCTKASTVYNTDKIESAGHDELPREVWAVHPYVS